MTILWVSLSIMCAVKGRILFYRAIQRKIKSPLFKKICIRSLVCQQQVYLSYIKATVISQSFTHNMAVRTSRHRYGRKLRRCHPMYTALSIGVAYGIDAKKCNTAITNWIYKFHKQSFIVSPHFRFLK